MERWWSKNEKSLSISKYYRSIVEDLTGRVPILLDVLLLRASSISKSDELKILSALSTSAQVTNMVVTVRHFAQRREEELHTSTRLLEYAIKIQCISCIINCHSFRKALHACITGDTVPPEVENLLDWQHFYVSGGVGSPICGFVRRSAAMYLRTVCPARGFLSPKWFDSLTVAANNPSVLGFFTEQMLLSWITLEGCTAAGAEFANCPKETVLFTSTGPPIPTRASGFRLYIPSSHQFRGVDAILVSLNLGVSPPTARVIGVQITISKNHSDSETSFFNDWQRWIEKPQLPAKDVSFGFLWILEDIGSRSRVEDIPENEKSFHTGEKITRPAFQQMVASVNDVSKDIGRRLKPVRDTL